MVAATRDDSNARGPNPKGRDELDASWDSEAALDHDGEWCERCRHHRVQGGWGGVVLCPSCQGDDKDRAKTLRVGALFAGYGGIELGLRLVLDCEVAWVSEVDKAANRVLAQRFPGVPNVGDVRTADWSSVEPVDVLTGGSPCQDLSNAGKRGGMTEGTRSNLWVSMREAIAILRPTLVVWENVRGALSAEATSDVELREGLLGVGRAGPYLRAVGRVLGDLADLGYDAAWRGVRASDVGAPHARFRVFVVATSQPDGEPRDERRRYASPEAEGGRSRSDPGGRRRALAPDAACRDESRIGDVEGLARRPDRSDTAESRLAPIASRSGPEGTARGESCARPSGTAPSGGRARIAPDSESVSYGERREPGGMAREAEGSPGADRDATRSRPDGRSEVGIGGSSALPGRAGSDALGGRRGTLERPLEWGPYAAAIARWESVTGRPAPAPTAVSARGGDRLNPLFVEWMMGLPEGHVTAVEGVSRNDQLKLLGNGVVPFQVAAAVDFLLDSLETAA